MRWRHKKDGSDDADNDLEDDLMMTILIYTNCVYWRGCVDYADDAYNNVENHNAVTMRLDWYSVLKNYDDDNDDVSLFTVTKMCKYKEGKLFL